MQIFTQLQLKLCEISRQNKPMTFANAPTPCHSPSSLSPFTVAVQTSIHNFPDSGLGT